MEETFTQVMNIERIVNIQQDDSLFLFSFRFTCSDFQLILQRRLNPMLLSREKDLYKEFPKAGRGKNCPGLQAGLGRTGLFGALATFSTWGGGLGSVNKLKKGPRLERPSFLISDFGFRIGGARAG